MLVRTGGGGIVFCIDCGMRTIGPEAIANRLHAGPIASCPSRGDENLFLTSRAAG